jgi:hypothetical protein
VNGHALVRVYERTSGLSSWVAVCECGQLFHGNSQRDVENAQANHEQDKADEALTCPNGCYLGHERNGEVVSRAAHYTGEGVELLRCPDCRIAWAINPDAFTADLVTIANFGIAS